MLTVFVYNVVQYVLHKKAKIERSASKANFDVTSMMSGSVFSTKNFNESPEKSFNRGVGTQRTNSKFQKPTSQR